MRGPTHGARRGAAEVNVRVELVRGGGGGAARVGEARGGGGVLLPHLLWFLRNLLIIYGPALRAPEGLGRGPPAGDASRWCMLVIPSG